MKSKKQILMVVVIIGLFPLLAYDTLWNKIKGSQRKEIEKSVHKSFDAEKSSHNDEHDYKIIRYYGREKQENPKDFKPNITINSEQRKHHTELTDIQDDDIQNDLNLFQQRKTRKKYYSNLNDKNIKPLKTQLQLKSLEGKIIPPHYSKSTSTETSIISAQTISKKTGKYNKFKGPVTAPTIEYPFNNNDINGSNHIKTKLDFNQLITKLKITQILGIGNYNTGRKPWSINLQSTGGKTLKNINLTEFSEPDLLYINKQLPEIISRTERVERVCKKNLHLQESRPIQLMWYTLNQPSIVWCPIYKAASGTWVTHLLNIAKHDSILRKKFASSLNKPIRKWNHIMAFKLFIPPKNDDDKTKIYEQSIRFLVARHPFERLLSAYRAKITSSRTYQLDGPVHAFIRKEILNKYRRNDSNLNLKGYKKFPTFSEFVEYFLDVTKGFNSSTNWLNHITNIFLPIWVKCNVCSADYNIIMTLDTIREDRKLLSILTHLPNLNKQLDVQTNYHLINGVHSKSLTNEFYGQLTKQQMILLKDRLQLDFDLFGYDIGKYIEMAKDFEEK